MIKCHVMHVIHRFDTGGLENGVVNLINHLDESAYQHSIVTLKGFNQDFCARVKTSNTSFYDLEKKDGNDPKIFFRLRKLIKNLKPDILHTRNTATIENQLVGWWCSVPLRIHGEHGWDVNDMHGQNKKYQMLRKFMRTYIHQYIGLSSEAVDYLQNTISVSQECIHHICNGVDIKRFSPATDSVDKRELLNSSFPEGFLSKDALVFGTVGRLAEVKNQTFLLESFIKLVETHPAQSSQFRLVIIGDGILKQPMENRAEQAGISNQVWFAGNRNDISTLMQGMNVFVLPSLAEGISNTILEASASGLSVIATRVGGNPELIEPSLAATHLVGVNDVSALVEAMSQYVVNPELIAKNGKLVRQHCVRNFSIDTMVNKYHQLYQSFSG